MIIGWFLLACFLVLIAFAIMDEVDRRK